jgi:hypothetical protein
LLLSRYTSQQEDQMVGHKEFMDVHDAWMRGKSISEIAR